MQTFNLTKSIRISRTGFGALPIQRIPEAESSAILRRAFEAGVTFYDTARVYSDSEHKLGAALSDVRDRIVIASKAMAKDGAGYKNNLADSLTQLGTDYIDIYQFHNPPSVPVPGGADGLYDAALMAKAQGKIRAIGISQHSLERAFEAVLSGLYDTLQYPFNHLATEREVELVRLCAEKGVGFIAMKALSGGLVTDARLPFAYLRQFENVAPIWGVQRMAELLQILELDRHPPALDAELSALIEADRRELAGAFCRSCGYCLPCPAGIPIHNANRMKQLLARSPSANWLTPEWREGMEKIEQCTKCGLCEKRCPYGLKPYETLPDQLAHYRSVVAP